jgi:hypothetical protein
VPPQPLQQLLISRNKALPGSKAAAAAATATAAVMKDAAVMSNAAAMIPAAGEHTSKLFCQLTCLPVQQLLVVTSIATRQAQVAIVLQW